MADHRARPELFRVDRIQAASVADEPVRRRQGAELADVWETLRRRVDDRSLGVDVVVRVRRASLRRFLSIYHADLTAPPPAEADAITHPGSSGPSGPEHVELRLRFHPMAAARPLLAFGADVEVVSPRELREELARVAAESVALYSGEGQG